MEFTRRIVAIFMVVALAVLEVSDVGAAEEPQSRQGSNPSGQVDSGSDLDAMSGMAAATSVDSAAVGSALDIPSSQVASVDLLGSDEQGIAVLDSSLAEFPTAGDSYLVLSTGRAADATLPNNESNLSTVLDGRSNSQGNDLVLLKLRLNPPSGSTCVTIDLRFLSEEFPEYVGSAYNDAFNAEGGLTDFQVGGSGTTSPYNFAYDAEGNPLTVNSAVGVSAVGDTTYDGATPVVSATGRIDYAGDGLFDLYLSIQDLGDSIYDSAAFVDRLRWSSTPTCDTGIEEFDDTDGDGLPNTWETGPADTDGDGTADLDLSKFGADPNHKDVFVEIDWMREEPDWCWIVCSGGHSHEPRWSAIKRVVSAFGNAPVSNPDGKTGINLHVDGGPNFIMNPSTGAKWGNLSRSNSVLEQTELGSYSGSNYNWAAFDVIRRENLERPRTQGFHYSIMGHYSPLDSKGKGFGGIARGTPGGDFLMTQGAGISETVEAGNFMHELGHTLGLRHGGTDNVNRKPNYLSVMNYLFSTRGLRIGGADGSMDYSRFTFDPLDEGSLIESSGVASGVPGYGARWYCPGDGDSTTTGIDDDLAGPINWNCNGSDPDAAPVSFDLNRSPATELHGAEDWSRLVFDGGGIGEMGLFEPPTETELTDEPGDVIPSNVEVGTSVVGPGSVLVPPGFARQELKFNVTNTGSTQSTYLIAIESDNSAITHEGSPTQVTLQPAGQTTVSTFAQFPKGTPTGTSANVTLRATPTTNSAMADSASATAVATPASATACDVATPTIQGTRFPDILVGTPGPDIIFGLGGSDVITGLGGDDLVCGGDGSDRINGGRGNDLLFGQAGVDFISGDWGDDSLFGGTGADWLAGGPGRDAGPDIAPEDHVSSVEDRLPALTAGSQDGIVPMTEPASPRDLPLVKTPVVARNDRISGVSREPLLVLSARRAR